ncbi:Basic endochitinase [Glycine max]|nr:Basic endochitinase [Glycine max]
MCNYCTAAESACSNAGDIVVYWGQGESEGTLKETCNSGLYKIVNIAFLAKFGGGRQPEINLAGLLRCAAPQCPFPDQHQNGAVPTGLFDFVWVQFYNNGPCQFESTDPTKFQKSWNQWVLSIRSRKIYVGLPASPSPATAVSGFVPTRTLITQVWGSNALG